MMHLSKYEIRSTKYELSKTPVFKTLAFAFLFILVACDSFTETHADFIKEAYNTSKIKKAVLYMGEGNATASDFLFVSVYGASHPVSNKDKSNTFTVDEDHGKTFLNSSSISFSWIGEDSLKISYDRNLRIFMQKEKVGNTTILYKAR